MKVGIVTGASSGMGKWFSIYIPMFFPEIEEMWLIGRNVSRLEKVARHVKIGTKIICCVFFSCPNKKWKNFVFIYSHKFSASALVSKEP